MDQSQPSPLFGGRYELISEGKDGSVEVVDREPWQRCWSCDATDNEKGEAFCTSCGADLRDRRYRGVITSTTGKTVLISSIQDEHVQSLIPPILDTVEEDGRLLVLLKQSDATPARVPLGEMVALRVGLALARMMNVLHNQHLAFEEVIAPNDLGITPAEQPQFLNLHPLEHMVHDKQADRMYSDLQSLAGLLESLTSTPRMTQRLDDGLNTTTAPLKFDEEPPLAMILREIRTGVIDTATDLVNRFDTVLMEHTSVLALRQHIGAGSDTGLLRDHNEDSLLYLKLCLNNTSIERTWGVYIVADGMGGHAGGEVASGLAIRRAAEVIMENYLAFSLDPEVRYDQIQVKEIVRHAVLQANEAVRQEALARSNDMGTTLTMALVVGDRATIANIGDSRTYLYREGKLRRITKDHSLVMRLVELGQIQEKDIYTHPQRNAVLRSLGDRSNVEVDLYTERLQPGDVLLLCSDGQWEMTHDPEMERILSTIDDVEPEVVCQELIVSANRAGGEDNITSIIVFFQEDVSSSP
jgi:protein phosphatase